MCYLISHLKVNPDLARDQQAHRAEHGRFFEEVAAGKILFRHFVELQPQSMSERFIHFFHWDFPNDTVYGDLGNGGEIIGHHH